MNSILLHSFDILRITMPFRMAGKADSKKTCIIYAYGTPFHLLPGDVHSNLSKLNNLSTQNVMWLKQVKDIICPSKNR